MTQEIIIQPSVELTGTAINPTLNKEQNIFMATDTAVAKTIENPQVNPTNVESTPNNGSSGSVAPNSGEVLQAFINDKLTPELLREYARRELEKVTTDQAAELRAKWEKAKRGAAKGKINDRSIEAAIAKGHAPEDVTSKGLLKITAKEIIENSNINEDNEMDPKVARALLDKEVLTPREQTQLLLAHKNRLIEAEKVLGGKKLTIEQKLAILKAHYVGLGEEGENGKDAGVYNLKQEQVTEKARILEEAGLDKDERREIIESGLTAAGAPPGTTNPYLVQRDSIITTQLATMPLSGRLDVIRNKIVQAHAASGAEGISQELFTSYYQDYKSGQDRTLGAPPPAAEEVAFSRTLKEVLDLTQIGFKQAEGDMDNPQMKFVNEFDYLKRAEDAATGAAAAAFKDQREQLVSEFVNSVNPSSSNIYDFTMMRIIPHKEALRRLAFRIAGQPLNSETSDYNLGFYGGINMDSITNLLQTLSENRTMVPDDTDRAERSRQLVDINTIKDALKFIHELNKNIVGNNLEGASQYAAFLQPEYQNRLQRLSPAIGSVQRVLESSYAHVLSRDGWINQTNYYEMMGVKKNAKTGEVELDQSSSVYDEFNYQVKMAGRHAGIATNDMANLGQMEDWEKMMAYNLGRNLFNISHRSAEWISQGQAPTGGGQYESFPQEGFSRIMNFGKQIILRFEVGKNRGGMRWFERVMDSMQRGRAHENYGKMQLEKIKGDDIKIFELPTLTGVRGWWASWRAMGGLLRQVDSKYEARGRVAGYTPFHKESANGNEIEIRPDTKAGLLLDMGAVYFKDASGKTKTFDDLGGDEAKADYYRSIFFKPGTGGHGHHAELRDDLRLSLGTIYKLALSPAPGHKAHENEHHFNEVKEEIRALIWERVGKDNPLAIIPYLNGMKFSANHSDSGLRGKKIELYKDTSYTDALGNVIHLDWNLFQKKLTFYNELRISKLRGQVDENGHVVVPPRPTYTLQDAISDTRGITGGADLELDLTAAEEAMLVKVENYAKAASKDMANVKYAFIPFMNDTVFETADYARPGAEAMKRHYNDLGNFNSSNGALAEAADNLGAITDYHKFVEFISKFSKGIVAVHGDNYAKEKSLPVIEATVAFFRRGENIIDKDGKEKYEGEDKLSRKKKLVRWIKQQDEIHEIAQKLHKPNSEAQMYYNIKTLALDRGQTYEAMEDLAAAGLMGHDEEEEYKKRFGGKGFFGFITRMILEGVMRGVKGGSLVSGMELLKRSFKGAVQ